MLTIQPKLFNSYQPSFKERFNSADADIAVISSEEYDRIREDLAQQRKEFTEMANDDEFQLPEHVRGALKVGAAGTTAILGGMAAGWGTRKSIEGFAKLAKTPTVMSFRKYIGDVATFISDASKNLKKQFLASNVYKTPANAISKKYNSFGKTKFGAPIVNFLNSVGRTIKQGVKSIKSVVADIKNDIKSIKGEQVKKVTVNTVGVSGGIRPV